MTDPYKEDITKLFDRTEENGKAIVALQTENGIKFKSINDDTTEIKTLVKDLSDDFTSQRYVREEDLGDLDDRVYGLETIAAQKKGFRDGIAWTITKIGLIIGGIGSFIGVILLLIEKFGS